MRILLALLAFSILVLPSVAAVAYPFYTPSGNLSLPNLTIPVSVTLGGRADLDSAANAYTNAIKSNISASVVSGAKNLTLAALDSAKSDDVAYLQTSERNLLLRYKECDESLGYTFCFTAITYPEEDGPPLGDRKLTTVRVVNGSYRLPVTITAVKNEGKLTAKRTLSATTSYPDEDVVATIVLTNTGTDVVTGVRIDETPPALLVKGDASAQTATLGIGDILTASYTIRPQVGGNYTFSGIVTPNLIKLLNNTLVVKDFLIFKVNNSNVTVGKPSPFNLLVKNNYVDNSKMTVTVTSTEPLEGTGDNWNNKGPGALESKSITIAPLGTLNLSGLVTAASVGEHSLDVEVNYLANGARVEKRRFTFTAREQGLIIKAVPSIGALDLTLLSDATVRADNIMVDWGDGLSETVTLLQADRSLLLTHKYAMTTVSPVTVSVSASFGERRFNENRSIAVPGLAGTPLQKPVTPTTATTKPATPSTAPSTAPSNTTAAPSPSTKPAAPGTAPSPVPSEKNEEGMLVRLLRWFNNLF